MPSSIDADPDAPADDDDLVPVDAATGYPVDWLIVQPSGQVGAVFGWFELVGGLVTPRTGLVALPLPDGGRMLATRETFVRARAAATTVRAGHPGLITIGVQVRSGDFVLGYYDRRTVRVNGTGLAAALSTLPLFQRHVRLWLRWPSDADERRRLRTNLADFAEVTGATVWAPAEPGEAVLLDGCLDLAAVGPPGAEGWQAYGPTGSFESDVDGRLVAVGGVRVAHLQAASLVSGQPARERELAERRDQVPDAGTSFTADLAVLADGRLAVRYRDGSLLAVGGRQFAQLLRDAGWTGSDVLLLSPITPEQAAGTRRHLADLVGHIKAPIRFAEVPADPAAPAPADGPADEVEASARDLIVRPTLPVPPQPVRAPSPVLPPPVAPPSPVLPPPVARPPLAGPPPVPDQPPALGVEAFGPTDGPDDDPFGPMFGPVGRTRLIDGPRLTTAEANPKHGLSWLPAQPQVNAEEFDVFVTCDRDPADAITSGVPSPALFLAGHLDADLLAERTTATHMLQVRVAPGGAIDLVATDVPPPPEFAEALGHNDVYILPAGWMSRCQIVTTYRITLDRAAVRQSGHEGVPLLLAPAGAAHGVPGLPAEAVRWPHARLRSAHRYLVLPGGSSAPTGLPITADRPDPTDGAVLVEVRVERNQAIDVAATASALAGLPAVRSIAPDLVAGGVTTLLPAAVFDSVVVRKAWRGDGGGWRSISLDGRARLGAWLRHEPAR